MRIKAFDFQPGDCLAGRYTIVRLLGAGWESEVYLVREGQTGIERTAKLFIPQRNPRNTVLRHTAKKLHRLRHCGALIQYVTNDQIEFNGKQVSFLISEYVDGTLFNDFMAELPGRRMPTFEALHLLHALACALEPIHAQREYHGDLHPGNIIIRRAGLGFDIKLIDIFRHRQQKSLSIRDDVWDAIRIFYDALGGSRFYSRQPDQVKQICRGLRRSLIASRFRHAGQLRLYLENLRWD